METKPLNFERPYSDYYAQQLEEAAEFEDFVCIQLAYKGIVIQNLKGHKGQIQRGENLNGIEIKNDKIFTRTRNIYIETHEKSNPNNPLYVLSGIYRNDNSWLYLIGDYSDLFIFGKKALKRLDAASPSWIIRKETPTSRGFLIHEKYAHKGAERHIKVGKN